MNSPVIEKGAGSGIRPIPKQYADKPNLWRVACELSTYKEPHKVLNALMAILSADMKGEQRHEQ